MYSKRIALALSFAAQGIVFVLIGQGGVWFGEDMQGALWYFCGCFILIGAIQSIDFPCLVSSVAAWSERKSRGTITGLWATCGQVGNIIGLQLAAVLLSHNGNNWTRLMIIVTELYAIFAIMLFTGFVAEPSEVGLMLADQEKVIVNKEVELFSTEFVSQV